MKKKKILGDILSILFLTIILGVVLVIIVPKGYMFASTTDWPTQHSVFPEYFRALFLKNKDLFPDFALNIGGGQNIYNFAYYGLFNPIFILSYFLPISNMYLYVMITMIITVYVSVILMYCFLRKHKFSTLTSFISTVAFLGASSLLFHAHRHIMFVNYMPFLILALMGVDRYFKKHKSDLLIINTFIMILMSYYYSVVGIAVLVIYGVYVYLKTTKKVTVKDFFKTGFRFLLPIFIGIFLAGILLIPTLNVILTSRGAINVHPSLKEIFMPFINLKYVLYKPYGIGLSVLTIFSLGYLFFKKKENLYLAIVLSLIIIFPFFTYLFNAFMYIDAKCLIPFLPLYIFIIAIFIEDLVKQNYKLGGALVLSLIILAMGVFSFTENIKYGLLLDTIVVLITIIIYHKFKFKPFLILLCCSPLVVSVIASKSDTLVNYNDYYNQSYQTEKELIAEITKEDKGMYRIVNHDTPLGNSNRSYGNLDYNFLTLYSSTYNVLYNDFYFNVMNNPLLNRNLFITSAPKNYPFLNLMGSKYIVSNRKTAFLGYKEIKVLNDIHLYENDSVLPMGYASSNLINIDYFNKIGYPYNQELILNNIVVDSDNIKNEPKSNVKKINLDLDLEELKKLDLTKKDGVYNINVKEKTNVVLPLKEKLENKLLYIRFTILEGNSCDIGDMEISINGIANKLTCNEWKYHNGNYTFDYVLPYNNLKKLNINLGIGNYKIKDIEFYSLDYNYLTKIKDNVDEFIFNKNKTKGDIIEGDINVSNDGYFVLSVPYDEGFTVYVDDLQVQYEKVNVALLGFKIKEGQHHIKIEYQAKGKTLGKYLSLTGVILGLGLIFMEEREKRKNDRRNIKK